MPRRRRPSAPLSTSAGAVDVDEAVARLDALGNATGFEVDDVVDTRSATTAVRRDCVDCVPALDLYDPGAESPKETWLRLLAHSRRFSAAADADPGAERRRLSGCTTSTWDGRT